MSTAVNQLLKLTVSQKVLHARNRAVLSIVGRRTGNKEEALKRGRGRQRQTTVLISAESKTITGDNTHAKKYSKKKQLGFIKMKVITSLKLENVIPAVKSMVKEGVSVVSDGSNSFNELKKDYIHSVKVIPKKTYKKYCHGFIQELVMPEECY
jgi:hypothetical protein